MFMGYTGWRHVKTGQHVANAPDDSPGNNYVRHIENVDHHDGEEHPYKLKVISLYQPYASLIFAKVKRHETRGWKWPDNMLGQAVGIHATLARIDTGSNYDLDDLCSGLFGGDYAKTLPRGAILGTAVPVISWPTEAAPPESAEDIYAGNWDPGRFATRLRSRTSWARPIPFKGQQGFWTVTEDQLNAAARELSDHD